MVSISWRQLSTQIFAYTKIALAFAKVKEEGGSARDDKLARLAGQEQKHSTAPVRDPPLAGPRLHLEN